jgi:hypothetical protein
MSLSESLTDILEADLPASFERFGKVLDARWIDTALQETGTATVRRRKLSATMVVWLVIGMALFRDRSINEVVTHLGLVLPSQKGQRPKAGKTVAPSAIPQGRYRVGDAPIKVIFEHTAEAWANAAAAEDRWRGLALYGVDGTTFRLPDTDENREAFGLPPSSRGQAGYPQTRLVALMALRSHLISAAAFGPYSGKKTGEHSLACSLWPLLPDHSLVIMDRLFIDYGLFYRMSHDDDGSVNGLKHWLVRAKKNLRWKTLEVFGKGDELVELSIGPAARKKDPTLPKKMVARAVCYQVKGFRPQTLLTSMIDPEQYPAAEMAALYHERWEIELGYDEIKTHMLERQEALRSKKAVGVRQEIWGIMLAYNLVRKEMLDVAEAAGVPPVRVSFRHSLMLIRVFCTVDAWTCAPGNLPKRLVSFHETLRSLLILPERRTERRYKRHVKIKMSSFKRNPGRPFAKESK